MAYASIENLYKAQQILEEPECYALEKVDGCSAWVTFTRDESEYTDNHGVKSTGNFHYHGGNLTAIALREILGNAQVELRLLQLNQDLGASKITVYGEAYGGKIQKCADRYGAITKFSAFDVSVDDRWLTVPEAEKIVLSLGLEFVHYIRIPTKLCEIDFWRDAISEQAIRNGVTTREGQFVRREGVILRSIDEKLDFRGNRIIAKHKRAEERETKTDRPVDTKKLEILKEARAIAEEWVVPGRISNAKSHFPEEFWSMSNMRSLIYYVVEDVIKEGSGEIIVTEAVRREISKRAAQLIKQDFVNALLG